MAAWIGDDMIDTIISYLPIDVRRRLTKKEYIACLDWFMTTYHSLPVHDGKGLFPKMLLLSSFPQRRGMISIYYSKIYGEDVDIFIQLMYRQPPYIIDSIPKNISYHPAAVDMFISYLHEGTPTIICPHAMKEIVSMIPSECLEGVSFYAEDVREMLREYPEMSGYTFNCIDAEGIPGCYVHASQ